MVLQRMQLSLTTKVNSALQTLEARNLSKKSRTVHSTQSEPVLLLLRSVMSAALMRHCRDEALRSAFGGKPENICSLRALSPLTTSGWKRGIIPRLHEWPPTGGSHGKPHRTTKILGDAWRRG